MSASHKTGLDPALMTTPGLYAKVCFALKQTCRKDESMNRLFHVQHTWTYMCEYFVHDREWNHS